MAGYGIVLRVSGEAECLNGVLGSHKHAQHITMKKHEHTSIDAFFRNMSMLDAQSSFG